MITYDKTGEGRNLNRHCLMSRYTCDTLTHASLRGTPAPCLLTVPIQSPCRLNPRLRRHHPDHQFGALTPASHLPGCFSLNTNKYCKFNYIYFGPSHCTLSSFQCCFRHFIFFASLAAIPSAIADFAPTTLAIAARTATTSTLPYPLPPSPPLSRPC